MPLLLWEEMVLPLNTFDKERALVCAVAESFIFIILNIQQEIAISVQHHVLK